MNRSGKRPNDPAAKAFALFDPLDRLRIAPAIVPADESKIGPFDSPFDMDGPGTFPREPMFHGIGYELIHCQGDRVCLLGGQRVGHDVNINGDARRHEMAKLFDGALHESAEIDAFAFANLVKLLVKRLERGEPGMNCVQGGAGFG